MTEEKTTLSDFTDSGDRPTSPQRKSAESNLKHRDLECKHSNSDLKSTGDNGDPDPSASNASGDEGPVCPYYLEKLSEYEHKSDKYDLSTLNCGYAIEYFTDVLDKNLVQGAEQNKISRVRNIIELLHERGVCAAGASKQNIIDVFTQLAKRGRTEETLSGYKTVIKALFTCLELASDVEPQTRRLWIKENIHPKDFPTGEGFEREPLSETEVKKLFDALDGLRNRLLVLVAVETGGRNFAIRSLKLKDVDLEDQAIELINSKRDRRYTVPISGEVTLLLRRWMGTEREAFVGSGNSDYIFPTEDGTQIGDSRFTQIVKDAAEEAGIQEIIGKMPISKRQKKAFETDKDYKEQHRVTPHALRHTFSNFLDDADLSLEERSNALDHDSKKVTKEHYTHQNNDYSELIRDVFSDTNYI
ncbi:tyrosine-type recombinase/integrase [Halovenus sp. HT40]|uniref:tyrosine-type recombinase/integrase n=1 Tax=Halovenus sp. HT40 TaxID=3126691 RepID=UPI00300EA3A6